MRGFDPLREREYESWLVVGNGRSGTRGSVEEGTAESSPALYVAGVYGWGDDELAGPELVAGPEWTHLAPRAGDEPIDLAQETLEHRRILDLYQGILFRTVRQRLPSGDELVFRSARFASLADRRLLCLVAELRCDARRVRLADRVALPRPLGPVAATHARTKDDHLTLDVHGRRGGRARFAFSSAEEKGRMERMGAVCRIVGTSSAEGRPEEILTRANNAGLERVLSEHRSAWRQRWDEADVIVEGDPSLQRALRFSLYHLISAGDPDSDIASIGARGLSGPGYKGHVFWDTDVFVIPFFIATHPPTARAHIAYRYRTLPAARARARALGRRGALYAWESADTGDDVTPPYGIAPDGSRIPILTAPQEHHISADVAWAVWRYWQYTGDDELLARMGAEIILETARFWASRARRGRDGRYHIAKVIGPDEYHEGVRDNAFTNVMACWNLERAIDVSELVRTFDPALWRDLSGRLTITSSELRRWHATARGLVDGFDPKTLLYEQFEGFFALDDTRAADLAERPFAADVVLPRARIGRTQIVKQADVLMLAHMLPEVVPREVAAENYRYYEPRTSHGSSLSPAIHGAVAARVGRFDEALRYVQLAAAVDLDDRMGNAALGVHVATMGGLWQAAVMGFGGVRPDGDAIQIDPRLPSAWSRLCFPVRWHRASIRVDASADRLALTLDQPASVAVGGSRPGLLLGGRHEFRRERNRWRAVSQEKDS